MVSVCCTVQSVFVLFLALILALVISEVSGCLHCLLYLLGVRTVEAAAYCHIPVTLWQRQSACSTSQSSGFLYTWSFLVVEKASLTSPGSQFRAPSRLLLRITDYLSLLPTFPGSDNCTQGVPVPWYGWKAYELSCSREF